MNALNVILSDAPNEYTFEKRYGAYKDAPFYEEAKHAYLHKRLNSGHECGVNTWHEQLIAGRVTPEDIKTIRYTNLVYFKNYTSSFLVQMTKPENPLSAQDIRSTIDAARHSFKLGGNKDELVDARTAIHDTLFLSIHFGGAAVASLRNHHGITRSAEMLVHLSKVNPEKALLALKYMDEYFDEIRLLSGANQKLITYMNNDFIKLMDAGVTAKHAAERTIQGLSIERALEASNISSTIAEGVL